MSSTDFKLETLFDEQLSTLEPQGCLRPITSQDSQRYNKTNMLVPQSFSCEQELIYPPLG